MRWRSLLHRVATTLGAVGCALLVAYVIAEQFRPTPLPDEPYVRYTVRTTLITDCLSRHSIPYQGTVTGDLMVPASQLQTATDRCGS